MISYDIITNSNQAVKVYEYDFKEAQQSFNYDELMPEGWNPTSAITIPHYAVNAPRFLQHFVEEDMWSKYVRGCLRTWNHNLTYAQQIGHATAGLAGEICEAMLLDLNVDSKGDVMSEIGDIIYFRTMARYLFGDSLVMQPTDENTRRVDVFYIMNYILSVGVKAAFQDSLENKKVIHRYTTIIPLVDNFIVECIEHSSLQLDEVLQFNLDKLNARYEGGKFDSSHT